MNKKLLRKKLALMLATLKKKRPFYTEIEYLEATGTQYIDTGYKPNTNTYVEMYAMYTSLDSTYRTPFSVRTSDGAANSFTISGATNTSNVYAFGSSYWAEANGCPDASTNIKYFMSLKSGVANFNGVTGNAGTTITPSNLTAYMFARNANGTASNFFIGRIYYCQIYDNDTLIRDFIPVLDWNYVPCMYDRVSEQLFYNQGTGSFVAGRQVHYVEYLESTGTQYIDTGYSFNSNTDEIELKYQNTSTLANKWLFGSYEDNANIGISSANLSQVTFWYKGNVWGAVSTQYNSEHILRYDSTGMSNDGINLKAFTSYTGTWNLYLFALNNTGTSPNGYYGYGKIWGYKHTRNGTLIRDFIPMVDELGVGAMFDRITHTIFDNAGTGQFIPASYQLDENGRVVEPEYE